MIHLFAQKTEPMLMLPHLLFEEEKLPILHARGSCKRCFECPCLAATEGKRQSDLEGESDGKSPDDCFDLLTRTAPSEEDLDWFGGIGFRVVVNDTADLGSAPRSISMAESGAPRRPACGSEAAANGAWLRPPAAAFLELRELVRDPVEGARPLSPRPLK